MFGTKYIMSKGLSFAEYEEMQMLSEYASRGWKLEKFAFMGYKLKKAEPEKLQYALDYRINPDEEYFSYFNEAGWTNVCSIGNIIHIFSAPEGTKKIYTDNDTEIEKHISMYQSLKKVAIPFSICFIILFILMAFVKYSYLPDIYNTVLLIISIPIIAVSIFTTIPCLEHYSKISELQKMSDSDKKPKISRFLILILITEIVQIILMVLKVISMPTGIYLIVFDIILLLSVYRRKFIK
ncbi:MAG: DUF2812 domain-containing protein [Clostridium beijerinckii]|jgi:hypothetical protein|uniref:DUF2812 domain-containing protein n=1 Tax=Clostridium beijerinckii TaxID=1520 RepID=UPI00098C668E|nr:DUF2812 domain-containing protein [Clostridium beijerinckii]MCI1584624.1 DUF2812 domain-containing protein [Clostridium beijerinckii]MCI1620952.1 DUF2812 domain-containing protein [Clostridium beijerinckii]NOW89879.1 hypothetical protein [Clostridium beijerinckii]NRT79797.1 hypothetical protein [Clostridium beijerinckii]OOM49174.1 hypothetical protein CBEIJ_15530 [Clostridium beijerinckii]